MTVRAFFIECSAPFWLQVATKLAGESGWKPCYWSGHPEIESSVKERFPDVVFHSTFDAIRGIRSKDLPDLKLAPLDEILLQGLSHDEAIFLKMLDRMEPGDSFFSYRERVRFWRALLMYWIAVLDLFHPDIVVFPESPHDGFNYVLYALCKKRGIKTLMFVTAIEDLFYPVERFEEGSPNLESTYERLLFRGSLPDEELSPKMANFLNKLSGEFSDDIHFFMKDRQVKSKRFHALGTVLSKALKLGRYPHYLSKAYEFLFDSAPLNYLKLRGKRFEETTMSYLDFIRRCKFEADKKRRELRAYYEKLTAAADLSKPFVFVALHYQPEKTTAPDGGLFVDQLLMIDLLSKTVPEGWFIYVKEHVTQFSKNGLGERSRTKDFYDDITALPNVRMVPLTLPSFDLIDRCQAVATVTGTVALEGAVRGKPALIFGHAWYRGCEGIFYTPTIETCRDALMKIQTGYPVDQEKVKLFLIALERVCLRGYVEAAFQPVAQVSEEENAFAIARVLQHYFENGKLSKAYELVR